MEGQGAGRGQTDERHPGSRGRGEQEEQSVRDLGLDCQGLTSLCGGQAFDPKPTKPRPRLCLKAGIHLSINCDKLGQP